MWVIHVAHVTHVPINLHFALEYALKYAEKRNKLFMISFRLKWVKPSTKRIVFFGYKELMDT